MRASLFRLSIADLERVFSVNIIPLLSDQSVELQFISLDDHILASLRDLLGERIRPPSQAADIPISREVAGRLGRISNLTEGARALVENARQLNDAIVVIFRDRAFKQFIRESFQTDEHRRRINALISDLSQPDAATAPPTSSMADRQVAQPSTSVSQVASTAKPLSVPKAFDGGFIASRLRAVRSSQQAIANRNGPDIDRVPLPPRLKAYEGKLISYTWAKAPASMTVADLVAHLRTYDPPARSNAVLNGLMRSDYRFLLVYICEAVDKGELRLPLAAEALVRVFTTRVFLQLNAIRSAEKIGRELQGNAALLGALPKGEVRRLDSLMARCAVRGGRATEAAQMYRRIALAYADHPESIMDYITSVFSQDVGEAIRHAKMVLLNQYAVSSEDLIFIGDLFAHNGEADYALASFFRILKSQPDYSDAYLGLANLALLAGNRPHWEDAVRRFLSFHALPDVRFSPDAHLAPFSIDLPPGPDSSAQEMRGDVPLVTVIMTSFNSAATLRLAVESVLTQTVGQLELFVVDDCSTDGSRDLILSLAAGDPRIKWIFNERNMGTYASKNAAIRRAAGNFITFHDSDDWMHPHRVKRHLSAMTGNIMCSVSNWIRMDDTGRTIVRRGGPYAHLNPASTFFRKEVFTQFGLFDNVRTGADSEILTRIRHRTGHSAVVDIPDLLAIGLHHEGSLTQSGTTAFDEHRYSPVRLDYTEAWVRWHLENLVGGQSALVLDAPPGARLFEAPSAILP